NAILDNADGAFGYNSSDGRHVLDRQKTLSSEAFVTAYETQETNNIIARTGVNAIVLNTFEGNNTSIANNHNDKELAAVGKLSPKTDLLNLLEDILKIDNEASTDIKLKCRNDKYGEQSKTVGTTAMKDRR
ncbi:Hypothetical predicted protein, partial [Olea europaea subsp. europaea]